jgi:phosphatidylinositol phospholipase C delta
MSLFLTHSKVKSGTTRAQLLSPNSKHTPNWRPSKGWGGSYLRAIDIADIHFWQVGVVASRALEQSLPYQTKLHHTPESDAEQVPQPKSKKNLSPAAVAATSYDPKIEGSIVTIFHHSCHGFGTLETLDLVIENPDHRRALVATLALLKKTYQETSQMTGNETLALRYIWKDMDLSLGCNMVTEREFTTICHRLQMEPPDSREYKDFCKTVREELKTESFVKTPAKYKHALSPENCMHFLQLLKMKRQAGPSPAMEAWKVCFGKANTVNDQTLLDKFLHGPQKEHLSCDILDARDIIGGMNAVEICGEKTRPLLARSTLTKAQFEEFLRSELNDIYDPLMKIAPDNEQEPLDRPISQYWINSSNNTFLMMSQDKVMGINDGTDRPCIVSSVEAYAKALESGARSIELCCIDGPMPLSPVDPFIPMVGAMDHASTITFQSVIMVIRRFLKANERTYPISINIENHCTKPFQVQMAKLLKTVFGNTLFIPTSIHRSKQLPSPDELIGMVIVNLKKPPNDDHDDVGGGKNPSSEIWSVQQNGSDVYAEMFNKFNSPAKPESRDVGTFLPETGVLSTTMPKKGKKGKGEDGSGGPQYANELLSLTMFHDATFSGYFEDSLDLVCSHMHTIDESQVPKIAIKYENNPELWRKFGEDHVTRIVPRAKDNFSSKNLNPVLAWSMGCQIVNINFHSTMDRNMALNDGMFRQMGGIGYIAKPPHIVGEAEKPPLKRLKVRILSGSCLQRPSRTQNDDKGDEEVVRKPYVVLELHDVQVSTVRDQEKFEVSSHKVKCAADSSNGFAPLFHDKGKDFVVETPDVAMLMFQAMDTDLGLLGMAAIPVSCLRRGYRSVQLYDKDCTREGAHAFATLLVYLQHQ